MKIKNSLGLLFIPFILGGCKVSQGEGDKTVTVTDMQNREVTFQKDKVDRVVCLGASALRLYSYVGDLDKLVGVEDIDSGSTFGVGEALRPYYLANKEKFSTLPSAGKGGPMAQSPDKEKLAALRPNIIVSFYSDPSVNDDLSATLNIPVIALKNGADGVFDETTHNSLKLLGTVFNRTTQAESLVNYINTCKNDFKSLIVSEATAYVGCIGNWGNTSLYGSYKNLPIFKYAKANAPIDEISRLPANKQAKVEKEELVAMNPDYIFVDSMSLGNFMADSDEVAIYNSLDAVKNNKAHLLLPFKAYDTNLEIELMSTYYVASVLHEDFEVNIGTKCDEISEKFLGKKLYNDMKNHPNAYNGYGEFHIQDYINE